MMALTIAARELRALFLSPLAWSILGVVQFILAYMFLAQLDTYLTLQPRLMGMEGAPGVTDIVVAPLFGSAAVVLLLVTPLVTMRLVSEELRNRTLTLLRSAPVTVTDIVLGKYLGVVGFLGIQLVLLALMPLSLLTGGALDTGKMASAFLGLALVLMAFAAVGLYMSTLTQQPTVAAVTTFGALLMLWIIDWAGQSTEAASGLFRYLSLMRHYESLLKGLFNTADIAYYVLMAALFVILSIRHLDAQRINR